MKINRREFGIGVSAVAGVSAFGFPAVAQKYPSQDVHFICGFAAGSGADVIVRWFAERMRPLMGANIIVENKPGAFSAIANQYVIRSKPDGYTIYVHGLNSAAANMHLLKNPGPDISTELQVVATVNRATMMIAVPADSPHKTIKDLTTHLKQRGEKASYGFANPTSRVLGALYRERAGHQAVEVGYRTGADYLNDLYSGNLDFAAVDNIQGMAQQNAGKMRLLAVGAGTRMQAVPDLPTMKENGYDMDIRSWWGAAVPIATPRPIVDQLNVWFSQIAASEDGKKFFNSIASDPWVTKPDEGQAYLKQQIGDWAEYVKIAKIEPQG